MTILDWSIVVFVIVGMIYSVRSTSGLMRSVSDFLAAGRSAGRYVISISSGAAGLGAITIVTYMEMNYIAGFSMSWWGMTTGIVILALSVCGWVIYRFRQTRCLTLAQFFEERYSRKFRIFTGLVAFVAGLINFGIFPAVGARFFIYFCGLPQSFPLFGFDVSMFPVLMIGLLSISLYFVFTGGQIAVIIADFFQGAFINIVFVIIILFLFVKVDMGQIHAALSQTPGREAAKEIVQVQETQQYKLLTEDEQLEQVLEIENKFENKSRINPFKTGHVEDFNFWFFLIGIIGVMYGTMSWQGAQAYNASAKSAHEAKMGGMLAGWRGMPQTLFFLFVPIVAYTLMHHSDFSHLAESVNASLAGVGSDTLISQLRVPLVLSYILPVGLLGAFAAVMIAAFISTHDTYLHSWGSILVQDVIMPMRKKPFSQKQHLLALRLSITFVALFIFFFSLLFNQTQKIALFFAITGAIFAGGSGAVIIGGLYWKRGTTQAAWTAMIVGASIAVSGIIAKQISSEWLALPDGFVFLKNFILGMRDINGQIYWAIGMGSSSLLYVVISLLTRTSCNMDKLLNRGEYAVYQELQVVNEVPDRGWRLLGMGREFTKGDKIIFILNYIWTGGWTVVFIIGTIYNLNHDVADAVWMRFWEIYLIIQIVIAVVSIFWFTTGGLIDLRKMLNRLQHRDRDESDDGFVVRENK
jgi:solute:Na+ symporter, SSS family